MQKAPSPQADEPSAPARPPDAPGAESIEDDQAAGAPRTVVDDIVVDNVRFDDFDLSDHLLEGLAAAGYVRPTPVQVHAIPPVLEGHDVIVQARTGTGKTAAFGLPLLELLDPDRAGVQALVLTPTRELAQQVAEEINRLGQFGEIRCVAVYGGDPMARQIRALQQPVQIVVGTPGRLLDHLGRRTLDVRRVRYFVLDEADEMLSMGFYRELTEILSYVPKKRNTLLFSATFPEAMEKLVARHVKDPVRVMLAKDEQLMGKVEHHYYIAPRREKDRYLVAVLDAEGIESAIVFCNRKDETRAVANVLRRAGYHALPINSDLTQAERDEVMGAIKLGELTVLVATDIAARGIDISDLRHVVNYSTPESSEMYVHRTGRTGRLGKTGTAVTLVAAHELSSLKSIEGLKGIDMEERRLPPDEVIMEHRVDRLMHDLKRLATVRSPEDRMKGEREDYQRVAEKLQGEEGGKDVLYMLLQSFFEGVRKGTASAARGTEVEAFAETLEPLPPRHGDRAPSAPRRSSSGRSSSGPGAGRRAPRRRT